MSKLFKTRNFLAMESLLFIAIIIIIMIGPNFFGKQLFGCYTTGDMVFCENPSKYSILGILDSLFEMTGLLFIIYLITFIISRLTKRTKNKN